MTPLKFIGWMYDIARDQSPDEQLLDELCRRSLESGYDAVCLYFEHRFAFKAAPWAQGPGAIQPEWIKRLSAKYKPLGLRLVPFLNTLGHMEGFCRAEGGQWLAEAPCSHQQQICPSKARNVEFVQALVAEAMDAFDDDWVHLGGDETWQLGQCDLCRARAEKIGKAGLYGEHFSKLCRQVLDRGRRPALWADMLLAYPEAMKQIPKETVLFDWHYDRRPAPTTKKLREAGFDVVCCPTVHIFDSNWCDLDDTKIKVDEHAEDAEKLGAQGICITSWEYNNLAIFNTYVPVIMAAGRRVKFKEEWPTAIEKAGGKAYAIAADMLGHDIPYSAEFIKPDRGATIRYHLAMRLNPFYLWSAWRDEVATRGSSVLHLCHTARAKLGRDDELQYVVELYRVGVEWVQQVEEAYRQYVARDFSACERALREAKPILGRLRPYLNKSAANGGAAQDLYRLEVLEHRVDEVVERLRRTVKGCKGTGYMPAFEMLVDNGYTPLDQAAWRTGQGR